jgi:SAM-dependent methyltransferase
MIHHDTCPVCSGKELSDFLSCRDHLISKETFVVCKCNKCGFVFTQDHPDESEAGKYYESEDYISHSDTKRNITDLAYQLIRRLMMNRKKRLVQGITGLSSGTILDIGCGTGHFLNSMKLAGWDIKGIEINEKARIYAESRFRIPVLTPEKIWTLSAGTYDCITLWHVLEHFYEPKEVMKEIFKLLRPEGICMIALPNNNSFDARYYGKDWAAYDVPRHLWHFNPNTFSLFSKVNNFEIRQKKKLPFDVFYISILSEKYRGAKIPFISGILKAKIFWLRSLSDSESSSSIIYILKKGNH